jgi:hypothetical protein
MRLHFTLLACIPVIRGFLDQHGRCGLNFSTKRILLGMGGYSMASTPYQFEHGFPAGGERDSISSLGLATRQMLRTMEWQTLPRGLFVCGGFATADRSSSAAAMQSMSIDTFPYKNQKESKLLGR